MQRIFLLLSFSVIAIYTFGQPLPCSDPPTMTSFCKDACIICDIDGFQGRHEATIVGEAPPGFAGECTFVAHNMQWIAFIAGSEDLEVKMSVSNCQMNRGLEFGLYKGNNCTNFTRISNCFGGAAGIVGPGGSGIIKNNEPLIIGQYYYIVMDGGVGDNCDWTFEVVSGDTRVDPLETSGFIDGDFTTCPNFESIYEVVPPVGATEFLWELNGQVLGSDSSTVLIDFDQNGIYTLCVTSSNACDEAPPTCNQILVQSIPDTELIMNLCEGDCFEVADTSLCTGGSYLFHLMAENGCDSLVIVELTEFETPILTLDIDICEGDTLFIGETPYLETGIFQEILLTEEECDSIVNLDLFTVICNITSTYQSQPVICHGEASGSLIFEVVNGTPPFSYNWSDLDSVFSGAGTINNLSEGIVIPDIAAGTYLITINDNFGNSDIIIAEVTEPDPLMVSLESIKYNGFDISCFEGNDGIVEAFASGGVPGYNYSWNNGDTTKQVINLSAGDYEVSVVDFGGCELTGNINLVQPPPILLTTDISDSSCEGLNTGIIAIANTSGGIEPYTYQLNLTGFKDDIQFTDLNPGTYNIQARDANGCVVEELIMLTAPQIPNIDLGDEIIVSLGETARLNVVINNVALTGINWTSPDSLSCLDCLTPSVQPLNSGFYKLEVSSVDGCTDIDSVMITVNKFRKFYAPNVFSPNQDGINDYFSIFGGPEVAKIKKLAIFDRWGGLRYEGSDLIPNILANGWDGKSNGELLNPGVFVWMADIEFLDGEVLSYTGNITLIR